MSIGNLFGTGGESNSLYGTSFNSDVASSFIYFEWFIFKVSTGQPAPPTGGSWNFATNTGVPPTGWTSFINGVPLDNLWFSIAFVDSRNPTNIVWSTTGLLASSASVYSTAYADTFTGNGSTVNWTLTTDPVVVNNLDVSINGVTQTPTVDYTISGTTFTTTTAAPLGSIILVKYRQALPNSYFGTANNVGYTPAGTGAVGTNVQAKLRQYVSVNDFGAGASQTSAQNKTAIQAAINSGYKNIYFPDANYNVDPGLVVNQNGMNLYGNSSINGTSLTFSAGLDAALWVGKNTNVSGFSISDIKLIGNSATPGSQNTNGLVLGSTSPYYYAVGVNIYNVFIQNFLATNAAALRLNTCWWVNVDGNTLLNDSYYGVYIPPTGNVTTTQFSGNTKIRVVRIGFYNECSTDSTDQFVFRNVSFEFNTLTAIYSTAPKAKYHIEDCYFEVNATDVGTNGQIFITSTDTGNVYGFATAHIENCQFHRVVSPATLGFDINLGYCQKSVVRDLQGLNNLLTAANSEVFYFNNRGNNAGNPLADYKTLLGTINATEYDPPTGYLVSYSSLGQVTSDTHIYSQQKIAAPVATLVGSPVNATISLLARSTDTAGRVEVVTTGATNLAPVFRLTFNKPYIYPPIVIVTPASTAAGAQFVDRKMSVESSTTYFDLNTGTAVTASGLTMGFNYVVIGIVA
jgi:hypothetical protein